MFRDNSRVTLKIDDAEEENIDEVPNDTVYKRWSCHSEHKLLCKLCRIISPPAMVAPFTVLLLTKAGEVEINPGPTTLNKRVWICDICHKQIHVRK